MEREQSITKAQRKVSYLCGHTLCVLKRVMTECLKAELIACASNLMILGFLWETLLFGAKPVTVFGIRCSILLLSSFALYDYRPIIAPLAIAPPSVEGHKCHFYSKAETNREWFQMELYRY
ncbi:hypothetical protein FCM35_KLT03790 [Carex littledalei]|uniref:Uncharacterized protein n=1 Tax=Carex littledalei TaxID=544730 RepID=A0A833QZF4_9POAL|nr:hypothetical protein FCM35_KLT03790 [Carex littledalei]